ncbi:MAG: hypothetical protein AAB434_03025 [Planctomycetota bacterium]
MDFVERFEAIARKAGLIVRRVKGCSASELKKIPLVPDVPEGYLKLFKNGKKRARKK